MITLMLMYVILAIGLGALLLWVRDSYIFTMFYVVIMVGLIFAGGQILGEPKPARLDFFNPDTMTVVHAELKEGEAIYVTIARDSGVPYLVSFPWNTKAAQQLKQALEKAREKGEGANVIVQRHSWLDHEGGENTPFDLQFPAPPPPKVIQQPNPRRH